jgi:hypothetical protein
LCSLLSIYSFVPRLDFLIFFLGCQIASRTAANKNIDKTIQKKRPMKQEKTIQKTSEIKYLNQNLYCSLPTVTAQLRKPARGLLSARAWAFGPAANGWAGQTAQRCLPLGLFSARAAAVSSQPFISDQRTEIHPLKSVGYISPRSPGKP